MDTQAEEHTQVADSIDVVTPAPVETSAASPEHPPERLRAAARRLPIITIAAIVFVLGGLAMLAFSFSNDDRPLLPNLPTFTPIPGAVITETVEIGFADLNADPAAYLGQRLQVVGDYTPLPPPECLDYTGPAIRWSLVAEELQLNAVGFENILRLVEEGTELTVTGIWSAYRGPVGCGKEPPDGTVWYLAVDRIVEPNPLFGAADPRLTVIPGSPQPTLSPLETPAEGTAPTAATTPGTPDAATVPATPAGTLPTVAATPTLPTTPLVTPGSTSGVPGSTPGTSVPGATPAQSSTPGPSPTPTATGNAAGTTTPGLPTATPGGPGYPGQGTPTATRPGGYP